MLRTLYIQIAPQATASYLVLVKNMGMLLPLVSMLEQLAVGAREARFP